MVNSSTAPTDPLPALLTTTSIRPNASSAVFTAEATCPASVTSSAAVRTSAPPRSCRSARVSGRRAVASTRSPAASAASAISRPKPAEQPVISQTRPSVFVIFTFLPVASSFHPGQDHGHAANTDALPQLQSEPVTPELRQLRYFVAVADETSFTRAAAGLHIAQQSLSQQITVLERALGTRLFDRDARGARLTAVGQLFLPEARAVLARAEEAVATLGRAVRGEIGSVRLVFLATTANYLLPPVVRAVREWFPDLAVTTAEASIAELVAGLREGRFDLAFTRPPLVGDLVSRTLLTEEVCAVLPAEHPL